MACIISPTFGGLFLSLFLLHHLYRRSINTCKLLLASSRSHGSFKLRLVTLYWHFCLLHHAFIHFFICRFGIHSLFCCSCFWCWSTYWGPEPRGILGRQFLDQEHHKTTSNAFFRVKATTKTLSEAFATIRRSILSPSDL